MRPDDTSPADATGTASPEVACVRVTGAAGVAVIEMVAVVPSASFIWEASVRFQMRS